MGFTLPTFNAGAGAPPVEDGLALARFDDMLLKEHPDWAGKDQYGHDDDGSRFHFEMTMLDDDLAVMYNEGDPIVLDATTRTSTGEKSNTFAILSGLLTPAELEAWKTQTEENPADLSKVPGRVVNVKVAHNKKGWPFIEQVISIAKKQTVKG